MGIEYKIYCPQAMLDKAEGGEAFKGALKKRSFVGETGHGVKCLKKDKGSTKGNTYEIKIAGVERILGIGTTAPGPDGTVINIICFSKYLVNAKTANGVNQAFCTAKNSLQKPAISIAVKGSKKSSDRGSGGGGAAERKSRSGGGAAAKKIPKAPAKDGDLEKGGVAKEGPKKSPKKPESRQLEEGKGSARGGK